MTSSAHPALVVGAILWLVAIVWTICLAMVAARRPWWVEMLDEIEDLPEAGPEVYPRDRPSQDDQP